LNPAESPSPALPSLDLRTARQLEKLRRVPIRDHVAVTKGRNAFLTQAQSLRMQEPSIRLSWYEWLGRLLRPRPGLLLRALIVVLIASGAVVAMSGLAAVTQLSLPDSPLYTLKMAFENTQIALASTAQARADLAMTFAYRRIKEIEVLDKTGVAAPSDAFVRMHRQMAYAFESAALMGDTEMQQTLQELDGQLLLQEEIVRRLKTPAPLETVEVIARQRIWVELGLVEPQGYREQLRQLGVEQLLPRK
jgi:Domain of unknown function (DUF5667)